MASIVRRVPAVEQGLLLGFPCPYCGEISRPLLADCGCCYLLACCAKKVPMSLFDDAVRLVAIVCNGAMYGAGRN